MRNPDSRDAMRATGADEVDGWKGLTEPFRHAVEHSPVAMAVAEGRTHIVRYVNPAFCRLFARERAEWLGRPFTETLPDGEQRPCLALLDRVYLTQDTVEVVDQKLVTADGNTLYWTFQAWPMFDETRSLAGVMLQGTDTTELIQARQRFEQTSAEMRAANEALLIAGIREQELAEIATTAEQRLHHAQRLEGIGRLAGGIAHDFNNLLTVILGFSELALGALPPGNEAQEYLEKIETAAKRAAALTSQLLMFARKQVIRPEVLNPNTLMLDMDRLLRRLIGEDIELESRLQPDAGPVNVDPGQFGQVLMNLAVNARDAMPQGGRLTIETKNVMLGEDGIRPPEGTSPGDYVMVTISDTGTGMTEEVQAHLFEPFYTTKEQGRGTGLGLATCYGIIQQNGGSIQIESELGTGTTVRIYLPRAAETPLPVGQEEETTPASRGTEVLLLVEDERMVRDIEAQALRLQGYTVFEAEDGKQALQVLRKHPGEIDLVVADLVMPVMGGRELADRLRKTQPHQKILFISGYTDDALVHRDVLGGKAMYLQKPFTPAALAQKVRDVLDQDPDPIAPAERSQAHEKTKGRPAR